MYKWILLFHAIGGAVLFGGHVYMESLMASATRSGDRGTYMTILTRVGTTAERIMPPAAIVTLVFGIWVVIEGSWKFEQLFVLIGFAVVAMAFAISIFLIRPLEAEMNEQIDEHGLESDEAAAKMSKLANLIHSQTLLVSFAFVVMFLKPGA